MIGPGTADARRLVTALLAGEAPADLAGVDCWQLLDQAAQLAYLAAGSCLLLDGAPHSRADIAAAWQAARPAIADRLAEHFGLEADVIGALQWADTILGGRGRWYIPAACPAEHAAVMLALVALLWAGRDLADWRAVCLALAD